MNNNIDGKYGVPISGHGNAGGLDSTSSVTKAPVVAANLQNAKTSLSGKFKVRNNTLVLHALPTPVFHV